GFLAYRFLAAEHLIARPGAAAAATAGVASTPAERGSAPATPAATTAPLELPDITLPDTTGAPRKLSAWRGHPLVVNFWATWCEPCRREIPLLESLRRKSADHLEVVGVAVDDRDPVLQYMKRTSIDYPVLVGGTDRGMAAIEAFGMQPALPVSVFADSQGRIVAAKLGELHPDDAELILTRLADVDAGRVPLAKARDEISSGLAGLAAARERAATSATAAQ
ncbi:MAG TPA: TlpA disulfide reductase family protein, partial [Steroidobacteraceae bacterium]|nr:TlpA disulfide reductase family protein [Steroidobacteraceae bacterium]